MQKDKEVSTFIEEYESKRQESIEANTKLELTIVSLLELISLVRLHSITRLNRAGTGQTGSSRHRAFEEVAE